MHYSYVCPSLSKKSLKFLCRILCTTMLFYHRRFPVNPQTLFIWTVSEDMSTLCFTFLATDFCSRLTMLFCSLSKMGKICRRYPNGENIIALLSQCNLALIGYIFLSITHLTSSPFWQQQVKILFAYNYNKLYVFYYTTISFVQLI